MLVQDLLLQRRVHRLQRWAFYNTRKCNYEKKLGFWQCGLLEETLGHLDLLVTWIAWIPWTFGSLGGAIGFLTSRTFGNFDILAIWISWQFGSWALLATLTSCDLFDDFSLRAIFLYFFSSKALELLMLWNFWQLFVTNFIFAQLGDKTK